MTDLTIVPKWNAAINRLERNEFATGGADGNMNIAPRQLAESIFWLKDELDKKTNADDVIEPTWGNITGDIAAQTDLSSMYFKVADFNGWADIVGQGLSSARLEGDFYDITTTEAANTHIDIDGTMKRSTATAPVFGTAAIRNVGTAAGQIPLAEQILNTSLSTKPLAVTSGDCNDFGVGTYYIIDGSLINTPPFSYAQVMTVVGFGGVAVNQIAFGYIGYGFAMRNKSNLGVWSPWVNMTNVFSLSSTGNAEVNSIQAGIGAPKLAYKKVIVPANVTIAPHGLDWTKIIAFSSGMYLASNRLQHVGVSIDAANVNANNVPTNYERTVLITYEV